MSSVFRALKWAQKYCSLLIAGSQPHTLQFAILGINMGFVFWSWSVAGREHGWEKQVLCMSVQQESPCGKPCLKSAEPSYMHCRELLCGAGVGRNQIESDK